MEGGRWRARGWGWGSGDEVGRGVGRGFADRVVVGSTVLSLVPQNTELCISAVAAADNVADSLFQGRVTEFIHAGKSMGISFFDTI